MSSKQGPKYSTSISGVSDESWNIMDYLDKSSKHTLKLTRYRNYTAYLLLFISLWTCKPDYTSHGKYECLQTRIQNANTQKNINAESTVVLLSRKEVGGGDTGDTRPFKSASFLFKINVKQN